MTKDMQTDDSQTATLECYCQFKIWKQNVFPFSFPIFVFQDISESVSPHICLSYFQLSAKLPYFLCVLHSGTIVSINATLEKQVNF